MKHGIGTEENRTPELAIPLETVCFIIMKARQLDVKEASTEPDPGSNPTDDNDAAVLQDHADDPAEEELTSLISDLSSDEQIDLVTAAHNEHTAGYLMGEPLLADHLTAGLDMIDLSCADYEDEHL